MTDQQTHQTPPASLTAPNHKAASCQYQASNVVECAKGGKAIGVGSKVLNVCFTDPTAWIRQRYISLTMAQKGLWAQQFVVPCVVCLSARQLTLHDASGGSDGNMSIFDFPQIDC